MLQKILIVAKFIKLDFNRHNLISTKSARPIKLGQAKTARVTQQKRLK